MKRLILSAIAMTAFVNTASADFQYAKSVPAEQKKMLTNDMFYLANQPYPADAKLNQLMGITASDGLTVLNWIDNRVSYIVSENFTLDEKSLYIINQNFFPQPSELPELPKTSKTPDDDNNSGDSGKVMTVMSNVGGAIYLMGKFSHALMGAKLDEKKVEMTSPRVGILKVGEGLFDTEAMIGAPANSILSRFFRLSTLVHEARHSDGSGKSVGFLHAICTSGRLEGYAACDANSNGPYTIGAQFLKVALQNCKDCNPAELEMMSKLALDSFDRVISPVPQSVDAELNASIISSYEILLSICNRTPGSCSDQDIKSYKSTIASARGQQAATQTGAAQAPLWDSAPEGTFPSISRDQTWANIYKMNQQAK